MTLLRRFICWILRRHTSRRLLAVDLGIYENTEHWICVDCLTLWLEFSGGGGMVCRVGTPEREAAQKWLNERATRMVEAARKKL